MEMRKTRILALVLAVLMVAVLFAGCGKKPPVESSTTTEPSQSTTDSTPEPTTTKLDFEGYTFTFVNGADSDERGFYYPEPANANQQGVWDTISELAETYNFKIADNPVGLKAINDLFQQHGLAGTSMGDFCASEQRGWGTAAANGYLRRLDTDEVRATGMDVLNPDQFCPYIVNACKLDDSVYGVLVSGEYQIVDNGDFFAFNKNLLVEAGYKVEDLYQAVRDYQWTWDVFLDMCKAAAKKNEETGLWDVCGVSKVFGQSFLYSMCDGPVYYKDGKYVSGFTDVQYVSSLNMLVDRIIMDGDVMACKNGQVGVGLGNSAGRETFYNQAALFGIVSLSNLNNNCDFAYGIVPFPRGSFRDEYVSTLLYAGVFTLQTATQTWEKSCAIFALMGDALQDADAGVALAESYMRDAESVEMFREYIQPNMRMELSTANQITYDAWGAFFDDVAPMGVRPALEKHVPLFQAAIDNAWKNFNK